MRANKFRVFGYSPDSVETFEKGVTRGYDESEIMTLDPNTSEGDRFNQKRRGRPRLNPYDYEKYIEYTNEQNQDKTGYLNEEYNYDSETQLSGVNENKELKDDYYFKESNKEDKDSEKELKDKNDTDTRLTSSTEVLSNFNYETIDNYEVSDNYDTIVNCTTTDEYMTSLNEDDCEFPIKTDSEFNLDETTLERSNDSSVSKESLSWKTKHFSESQEEMKSPVKEYEVSKEETELIKPVESELEKARARERELLDREKRILDGENIYVISEELRQSYIRQSKLLPKIRGVWFNSTVRRMGWVGQAYKKCKRIEKIFSINKHGFEGARKLAIAFRNSQKPASKSELINYPDISLNDVLKPISQLKIKLSTQKDASTTTKELVASNSETANKESREFTKEFPKENLKEFSKENLREVDEEYGPERSGNGGDYQLSSSLKLKPLQGDDNDVDDYVYPVDYNSIIYNYKSHLNREEKLVRDNTCREALLFMLYELAALVELDFPIPPFSKVDCKRGISYHINFLENLKHSMDLLPYINSLAHYICKGITPTDMGHFELYSLIHTLTHCKPLKMEFTN